MERPENWSEMGPWERLAWIAAALDERAAAMQGMDPREITAEQHQEVDELTAEYAELRASIDRDRAELMAAGAEPSDPTWRDADPAQIAALSGQSVFGGGRSGGAGPLAPLAGAEALAYVQAATGEPIPPELARRYEALTGGSTRGARGGALVPLVQASTTTLMPGTDMDRPIEGAVYPTRVLEMLGVGMVSVGYGEQVYRWIRPAAAAMVAEGTAFSATDSRTDEVRLKPLAAPAATTLTVEASGLDRGAAGSIVNNLRAAVMDRMEAQVLAGDGTAPNVTGILTPDPTVGATAATGAASSFADVVTMLSGLVDGKFANRLADLAVVLGSDIHAHLAGLYPASSGDRNVLQVLGAQGVTFTVSAHVPAQDSTTMIGKIAVRRGRRPGAHALPVWTSAELLTAPFDRDGDANIILRQLLVMYGMFNFALAPSDAGTAGATRGDFVIAGVRTATVS